jgi:hypothetical protein
MELWVGEHYGYQRLPSRVTHKRSVVCIADQYWFIVDDILGQEHETVQLFWHFADLPYHCEKNNICLRLKEGFVDLTVLASVDGMNLRIERGLDSDIRMGWYSLYYGERLPAPTLCAELKHKLPIRFISIFSFNTKFDDADSTFVSSVLLNTESDSIDVNMLKQYNNT